MPRNYQLFKFCHFKLCFMRKIYLLLFTVFLFTGHSVIAQCTNTSSFGSATINASGISTTISTCSFAGEYSTISGAVSGQTLSFTSSVATDLITIHSGTSNGPVVAFGTTPLVFPILLPVHYMHIGILPPVVAQVHAVQLLFSVQVVHHRHHLQMTYVLVLSLLLVVKH